MKKLEYISLADMGNIKGGKYIQLSDGTWVYIPDENND